jgi:hypothetical protein
MYTREQQDKCFENERDFAPRSDRRQDDTQEQEPSERGFVDAGFDVKRSLERRIHAPQTLTLPCESRCNIAPTLTFTVDAILQR